MMAKTSFCCFSDMISVTVKTQEEADEVVDLVDQQNVKY